MPAFLFDVDQLIFHLLQCRGQSHLYRSHAGRHSYGTENEIWAAFGQVGNTEKKIGCRL